MTYIRPFNAILLLLSCMRLAAHEQHTLPRAEGSPIVYYLHLPQAQTPPRPYPIAVICEGSYCAYEKISSVRDLQEYFTHCLTPVGCAVLTVEKWGVEGDRVDKAAFHAHNTRSQRVIDHQRVVQHFATCPPANWDGTWIFIGGSEGGDVATHLTIANAHHTRATAIFAGIGAWSAQDELWAFVQWARSHAPWWMRLYAWLALPSTRAAYDAKIATILADPTTDRWWLGQTYAYWHDAITRDVDAAQLLALSVPLLVVMGSKDPSIASCDAFVDQARATNAPVTYWRLEGVEHCISQNAPETFDRAAMWLKERLLL